MFHVRTLHVIVLCSSKHIYSEHEFNDEFDELMFYNYNSLDIEIWPKKPFEVKDV